MPGLNERFGRTVRELRLDIGFSQEKLAQRAKVSRNFVGSLERGEFGVSLEVAERLAAALNIALNDLIRLAEVARETLPEPRARHFTVRKHTEHFEQLVAERTRALEEAQVQILQRLAAAAEFRDDETGQHTLRVGHLASLLAKEIGMSTDQVDQIRRAAPLHDVGKIGIPDSILLKEGRLTRGERRTVRTHATIGADMLGGGHSPLLQTAQRIARSHHERWDGKGYPDGSAEERIPVEARIVAVADFYDALTHRRPYREAWPVEKTLATIVARRARQFDPVVVDALVDIEGSALKFAQRDP
jgi:putative two-component system response regulator